MKTVVMALAATLVAVTSVASAASIEGARDIQRYQKAAGDEVSQMPAGALVDWQALNNQSLEVWTANDKPWLVRFEQPCQGLMQAKNVALTSRDGKVAVGTDVVELGSEHCKIATIQPVDYAKIVATHHNVHHFSKPLPKAPAA